MKLLSFFIHLVHLVPNHSVGKARACVHENKRDSYKFEKDPFVNKCEKCSLFYLKNSFCSQDN